MPTDPELLQRYARQDDQEAFAELVRRHVDFVYAAAVRQTGSPARAEDVTQAVFTDLARKSSGLTGRKELAGWLFTSARYAALALRRSEARRQNREQEAHAMQDVTRPEESAHDWERIKPVLDEALAELGESDRAAVLLRHFQQRSFAEVGTALGLSEEAARKRVARALGALRRKLSKRAVVSTAAALEMVLGAEAAVTAPAGLAASAAGQALTLAAVAAVPAWTIWLGAAGKIAAGVAAGAAVGAAALFAWTEREAADALERDLAFQRNLRPVTEARRVLRMAAVAHEEQDLRTEVDALKKKVATAMARAGAGGAVNAQLDRVLGLLGDAEFFEMVLRFGRVFTHERATTFEQLRGMNAGTVARLEVVLNPPYALTPSLEIADHGGGHGEISVRVSGSAAVDDDALRGVLGDAGTAAYYRYTNTQPLRLQVVDVLAANLAYSGSPLTRAQAEQLMGVLAAATPDPTTPDAMAIDWDKALAQAHGLLQPTQWSALARLSGNLSTNWNVPTL